MVLYNTAFSFAACSSTVAIPLGLASVPYIVATGGKGFGHLNKVCHMVNHLSMKILLVSKITRFP